MLNLFNYSNSLFFFTNHKDIVTKDSFFRYFVVVINYGFATTIVNALFFLYAQLLLVYSFLYNLLVTSYSIVMVFLFVNAVIIEFFSSPVFILGEVISWLSQNDGFYSHLMMMPVSALSPSAAGAVVGAGVGVGAAGAVGANVQAGAAFINEGWSAMGFQAHLVANLADAGPNVDPLTGAVMTFVNL